MSMERECIHCKASDGKWYLYLAENEYGGYEDCTAYGPFDSDEEVEKFRQNHFSNPGGLYRDDSGTEPPPTVSPNGSPVEDPKEYARHSFAGVRWL